MKNDKQPSERGREICAFRNRVRRYPAKKSSRDKQRRKGDRRRAIADSRDN